MTSHIAIIGLGAMGMGMAKHIIAAGMTLKGYDIDARRRAEFQNLGGIAADNVADAAAGADALLLMVVNNGQARDVLFGGGDAASVLPKQSPVIVCSTIAPSDIKALAADLRARGIAVVDAPVSGGKAGADAGTLTVMASGEKAARARALPVLRAFAKKVHCLGDAPGAGATYKMVHQLAAGVHLVAAAELMALGAKAGCDLPALREIVSTSAGQSWMFDDRAPRMLNNDYHPRSMVNIFIKDLNMILREGEALAMPLPLAAAARDMLQAAADMGHGALDDAAVVKAYEAAGDVRVNPPPP